MKKQAINELPFIHLFETISGYYLYDVNRNKFIQIPKDVYRFLEHQQKLCEQNPASAATETYVNNLMKRGFLKSRHVEKVKHPYTDVAKYFLKHHIVHLVLQITQSCNLRCEYCVYSGNYRNRTHSNKQMTFETARRAMDYYIAHSRDAEQLSVGFYGGEPCLNYKLVQKCVAYMEAAAEGRDVLYSMTTNATLLDKENIDFFVQHGFHLLISLDGPEEIHNKHRKFASDRAGTFQTVLQNIQYMKNNHPEYCHKNVAFNMVVDSENGFFQLSEFIRKNPVISDIVFQTNMIDPKNTDMVPSVNPAYLEEINYERFLLFLELLGIVPKGSASKLLATYGRELRRTLYENNSLIMSLPEEGHHSGPCVPGSVRLFVTTDGLFYPCERVSEELKEAVIGDIDKGIDLERAEDLLNYGRQSASRCRNCWAYRCCDQCISYMDEDEQCMEKYCEITRLNVQERIKDACTLESLGFDYALTDDETE